MKSDKYFCVYVIDNLTDETVCVGDFLTRSEAMRLTRAINEFQACKVVVEGSQFKRRDEE